MLVESSKTFISSIDMMFDGELAWSANYHLLSIGTLNKFYGYPYTGDMAEIRWWARAATAAEIVAAASTGAP